MQLTSISQVGEFSPDKFYISFIPRLNGHLQTKGGLYGVVLSNMLRGTSFSIPFRLFKPISLICEMGIKRALQPSSHHEKQKCSWPTGSTQSTSPDEHLYAFTLRTDQVGVQYCSQSLDTLLAPALNSWSHC